MSALGAAAPVPSPPVLRRPFARSWDARALRIPRRELLAVLAAWALFVPVFAGRMHYDFRGTRSWGHLLQVAAADMCAWAALSVAGWVLARALPWERRRWKRFVAVHAAAAVVLAVVRVLAEQRYMCMFASERPCVDLGVLPYSAAVTLFFYLPILGTVYGIEFARRLHHRELASARLERELSRTQLRALRAHLQPHFLFNTLNTVVSLVRRDPDGAEEMIGDLGDLLRASLVHEQTHEVTLREELALLDPYLRIHQVRFGPRLRVERRVDAAALDALVPPMVLQPLVENAIRHGIGTCPDAGRVEIVAEQIEGSLRLRVADDGPGFASTWREGVGLGSTRARLRHQYAGAARLETSAAPGGGGVVEVVLPWRPAPDAEGAR